MELVIKDRIRAIRKQEGLSQNDFGARIACTKAQVAQWELGNNYPGLENLIKIANEFDTTTDWILTGRDGNVNRIDPIVSSIREKFAELESSVLALKREIWHDQQQLLLGTNKDVLPSEIQMIESDYKSRNKKSSKDAKNNPRT